MCKSLYLLTQFLTTFIPSVRPFCPNHLLRLAKTIAKQGAWESFGVKFPYNKQSLKGQCRDIFVLFFLLMNRLKQFRKNFRFRVDIRLQHHVRIVYDFTDILPTQSTTTSTRGSRCQQTREFREYLHGIVITNLISYRVVD